MAKVDLKNQDDDPNEAFQVNLGDYLNLYYLSEDIPIHNHPGAEKTNSAICLESLNEDASCGLVAKENEFRLASVDDQDKEFVLHYIAKSFYSRRRLAQTREKVAAFTSSLSAAEAPEMDTFHNIELKKIQEFHQLEVSTTEIMLFANEKKPDDNKLTISKKKQEGGKDLLPKCKFLPVINVKSSNDQVRAVTSDTSKTHMFSSKHLLKLLSAQY